MKIAVTGSSGFIGSRLVEVLGSLGHDIIAIDIQNGIDITNFDMLSRIGEFEMIYHLAAKTFVPDSYRKPRDFYHVNVNGTLNILELCRIRKAKIVFSSSYIYGNPQYLPIDESHPIIAFNPYAQSKIIGENLCTGYNRDFNVPTIIFRPFNIYGPKQNENFLIPEIISQARNGEITLKDGEPKRDYIFIDDLVSAYLKCIDLNSKNIEVFNVGSGKSYSVKEIVKIVNDNFKYEIKVNYLNQRRQHEVMNTIANTRKIENILKWKSETDIFAGIRSVLHTCNTLD
jgi:nucleoside-diphosphate-sugar epimerase